MIRNKIPFILFSLVSMLSFDVFSNDPKVCFFVDENYKGESLCTTEGNAINDIPLKWNDRISSISVPRGLVVSIFKDINFSGRTLTLKDSVDSLSSLRWADLNDNISSFKVRSAACFYELDAFAGDSFCLSGNESLDLYHDSDPADRKYHIVNTFNDRISSIKLPPDTQVTLYEDDNYSGKYYVIMNDFSAGDLEAIGMNKNITSMKVSQQEYFTCDQYCIVKKSIYIPIGYEFGKYWIDDRIKYKDVLISFNISGEDNYAIELFDGGIIKVMGLVILLLHKNHQENSYIFELDELSDTLSFLFRFNGGYSEVQFIESVGSQAVYISPLVGSLFDVEFANIRLFVENYNNKYYDHKSKPLIINKVVLAAEKMSSRQVRSFIGNAACWFIPIISIYNYVIQGNCNQADRFINNTVAFFANNDNKILQISGSAKPLPKKNTNNTMEFETSITDISSDIEATLTHINVDMWSKALTIPATALACKVPMKEQLLPNLRIRRDLTPNCVDWTLSILTDFTLLFGDSVDHWNAENFGRVIEHIIKEGNIDDTQTNGLVETRLIESVQAHLAENAAGFLHIKTAFDFSQLSYANYLRQHDADNSAHSPAVAQELSLGRYELALPNFQFTVTPPRIRRGGNWVEDSELNFDIEVISGTTDNTLAARLNIIPVINQWRKVYHQAKQPSLTVPASGENMDDPVSKDDKVLTDTGASSSAGRRGINDAVTTGDGVIEAARIVSDVAQSWLRTSSDDYIYVVVRLSGQIISITMAIDINEFDVGISGSLTHPDYVLHPEAEGTIRGAGTAAIRALAEHLSKKGKRALVSDVISKPSAIVKKKVGFKFIDEL
ncbi:beta/Gamma crystallin family protein [Yersinia rochesterensis]|uniref:Beta/Gamma crystallin family protein n=3 Tax=Yersinia rochesterensis TaxID=1604335 RepID=A0ABN4FDZ2_9GAMM|nr:peptidase inhibitor family I36 protein [Yersinia rochesterensis]AIN17658.1 beta/Gamma crystallin family protein [Yersinia rochesterensis]AJI87760.1 beta/Gamma crystallin family protein [Yersinia frederiksenii Y225]AJJ35592.1 beta/Gamma crystallin family protein [Yersinia rochesterensis]CRY60192.1 beta-gamma-crystallin [Yersinia kristensenii]